MKINFNSLSDDKKILLCLSIICTDFIDLVGVDYFLKKDNTPLAMIIKILEKWVVDNKVDGNVDGQNFDNAINYMKSVVCGDYDGRKH